MRSACASSADCAVPLPFVLPFSLPADVLVGAVSESAEQTSLPGQFGSVPPKTSCWSFFPSESESAR